MSVIVFFSTNEGIVVVGDRANGAKVFGFDNHTIVGVTGSSGLAHGFDAAKVISDYGLKNPYKELDEFWEGLLKPLFGQLDGKVASGFAFQAMFAHVPPEDGAIWTFRCLEVQTQAHAESDEFKLDAEIVPHPMPGVSVIGDDRVFVELRDGKDPRFDDLRAEELIRLQRAPEREFTMQEAVAFSKRLCAVTAERAHLLGPVEADHKPTAVPDAWLLAETGWRRLKK